MDNISRGNRWSVVGYKTKDGDRFLFNSQGELTDGDKLYESSEALVASVDATPIKLIRNNVPYYYH